MGGDTLESMQITLCWIFQARTYRRRWLAPSTISDDCRSGRRKADRQKGTASTACGRP